ncbi:hypothetical protein OCK01_20605 [Rhizobium sp. TRM95796]|nr:hypothetical protein [Rhizobium sp. TRM95796]
MVLGYCWPGNIRELDNAIAFAAALCEGGVIEVVDLPDHLTLTGVLPDREKDEADVRAILSICKGNVSEAARRLGVDRTTLHRRMKRLGIERPH